MASSSVVSSINFMPARALFAVLAGVFLIVASPPVQGQVNEDFELLPSDGFAGQEFGYSVAINAGVIAVGARFDDDNGADSGSAYLFDGSTGSQLRELLPTDGTAGAQFGFSIDVAERLRAPLLEVAGKAATSPTPVASIVRSKRRRAERLVPQKQNR